MKSVSAATQRENARQPSSLQQPDEGGEGFRVLHVICAAIPACPWWPVLGTLLVHRGNLGQPWVPRRGSAHEGGILSQALGNS